MAVQAQQITVLSDGTAVTAFTNEAINQSEVCVRNTGSVNLVLGGPDGNLVFPLLPGEFLGLLVGGDDTLRVAVQTVGTAGQVTILVS